MVQELVEDFKENSPLELGVRSKGEAAKLREQGDYPREVWRRRDKGRWISLAEGAGIQGRSSLYKTGGT